MSFSPEIARSLGSIETALERAATRSTETKAQLAELADRLNIVEQRGSAKLPDALTRKADENIVRVHNATGDSPIHLVKSAGRVADLMPRRKQEVSLGRFLAAGLLGDRCHDPEALRFVAETKAVSTATSGLTIPIEYAGTWLDLLRSRMVLIEAGCMTMPMIGKTHTTAVLTADPVAGWHAENAADISPSDPTFAARTLNAQTVTVRCTASVEVTQDSPNFGDLLASAMTAAIAQEIDRVGLVGTGTAPQPRGIYNTAGINEVLTVGTLADYSKVLTGVRELLNDNVPLEIATANAIMSPRTWAALEGLTTGIAGDKTQLPRPRALEAMRSLVTSSVPDNFDTNKSAIFLGDFRDLVMGVRSDVVVKALEVDTYASRLQIEFVAHQRVDFVAVRPASFCVLRGVS